MKALVLAAGKSSRIASRAGGLPKPLISIGGEPILLHTLGWLEKHGVKDIWVNLHYKGVVIRGAIGDGSRFSVKVQYSEEKEILGTAGAVKKLEREWREPFVVVYGDNYVGFDLTKMLETHRTSQAIVTIAVFNWEHDPHSGIAGGRVLMDKDLKITGFVEAGGKAKADSNWVNAGVYICNPAICRDIPSGQLSDFGKDIFPLLLERRANLVGFPIQSYCLAVDTPEALSQAEKQVSELKSTKGNL